MYSDDNAEVSPALPTGNEVFWPKGRLHITKNKTDCTSISHEGGEKIPSEDLNVITC